MGCLDGPRGLQSRATPAGPDYSEYQELTVRLDKLLEDMARNYKAYGDSKAALEFSGDRRKEALADAFVAIRDKNPEEAAGSAEHRARNSPRYKERLAALLADEMAAESTKNWYELLRIRVEVARSRMAVIRTILGLV